MIFECRQIMHGQFADAPPSYFTRDETDAVEWAKANLTRAHQQVTIEVCDPADVSTFALRHITHTLGPGADSGWRCWRLGTFVGHVSLAALFADRSVA